MIPEFSKAIIRSIIYLRRDMRFLKNNRKNIKEENKSKNLTHEYM